MLSTVKQEITSVLPLYRYVIYSAYINQKLRVHRSSIGLFLEPVLLVVSTFFIALVWNKLFGKGGGREFRDFFIYVLISLFIWNFISSNINQLCMSLIRRVKQIINTRDPIVLGILIDVVNNIMTFMFSLPIVIILLALLSELTGVGILYFLYGVFLIILSSIGWGLLVSIGCLFFGDLRTLVNSTMRIGFLLTPIIWEVERLGDYQQYIYFNPFYNYLAICRDGLMLGSVGDLELIIATALTIVIFCLGIFTLAKYKISVRRHIFSL